MACCVLTSDSISLLRPGCRPFSYQERFGHGVGVVVFLQGKSTAAGMPRVAVSKSQGKRGSRRVWRGSSAIGCGGGRVGSSPRRVAYVQLPSLVQRLCLVVTSG